MNKSTYKIEIDSAGMNLHPIQYLQTSTDSLSNLR